MEDKLNEAYKRLISILLESEKAVGKASSKSSQEYSAKVKKALKGLDRSKFHITWTRGKPTATRTTAADRKRWKEQEEKDFLA